MKRIWFPILFALLAVTILVALLPTSATLAVPMGVINVSDTNQDDPLDPNADSNGTCTLSEAIRAANTDMAVDACPAGSGADTIMLGANTYSVQYQDNFQDGYNGLPSVSSDITIMGVTSDSTIIQRSGSDNYRLLRVGTDASLRLENVTIRQGEGDAGMQGAAILNSAGYLTVSNSSLVENNAQGGGGAIANVAGGQAWISQSSLTTNTSQGDPSYTRDGGAIYNSGSYLWIDQSNLSLNTADGNGGAIYSFNGGRLTVTLSNFALNISNMDLDEGGSGGAIYSNSAGDDALTISVTAFLENKANHPDPDLGDANGGAIWSDSLIVTGSLFSLNTAMSGGAIYHFAGDASIQYSVLLENGATQNGAGLYTNQTTEVLSTTLEGNATILGDGGGIYNTAELDVLFSTLSNNAAGGGDGGGIFNAEDGFVRATNSTISGNRADFGGGGGIATEGNSVLLVYSTVADNASDLGNGIMVSDTVQLRNTIVANNGSGGTGGDCSAPVISFGYNLDSDGSCGLTETGDQPGTDPQLDGLALNGGPTLTHALMPSSPAIDGANPADCTDEEDVPLEADQRGEPRPLDGNSDGTLICDIGAYEAEEGAGAPTNTPTPTQTATPSHTATSTPTSTPTHTPTSTSTSSPTSTPTNTPTSTQTNTPTSSPTNTSTGTVTATPTSSSTSTPTPTTTGTTTVTPTSTPTSTPTNTSTGTVTSSPTSSSTSTSTVTSTGTPTATPTTTPTGTAMVTSTNTPTPTVSPTETDPSAVRVSGMMANRSSVGSGWLLLLGVFALGAAGVAQHRRQMK